MPAQFKSLRALADSVADNPELQHQLKQDPTATLQRLAAATQVPDTWIYRIVVLSLGLTVLIALVGAIVLAARGNGPIPDVLTALGSAAVGALAGLLAPSPSAQ